MKPRQLALLVFVLALLAAAVTLAPLVAPNSAFGKKVSPKLGLDIQGGARVVLEADLTTLPKGQKWDEDTRASVLRTLDNRVNANGVAEPVITPKGEAQFVVEIPAVKNEKDIVDQLQRTAQLEFYYSPDWYSAEKNKLGRYAFKTAEDGSRESFEIHDNTTNKTFRDPFHILGALRQLVDAGERANAAPVALPAPLNSLGSFSGLETVKVQESDKAAMSALADELGQFNAFLAAARKELAGSDLVPGRARASFGNGTNAIVELEFNSVGQEKFANFTKAHTDEILMIFLDGRILSAPRINDPITDGRAQISPFPTLKVAKELSDYLNGGALPVSLKIVQQQSLEATLGKDAVKSGLTAGVVALLLVGVFMIAIYRLPGFVAVCALLLYTLFTYAVFVLIPVTFTLPGIAGFILSVGMAVDANILIFERTKEELKAGKNLKLAITAGFQRAFSAIFDSNMCTAVTSLLLYQLGNGSVRGFALTLMIGVALSMFTAITVTRSFLLLLVGDNKTVNMEAWGVNNLWRPHYRVIANRFKWYFLSLAIIVPGIAFAVLGGFKQGIEFTGGSELTLKFAKSVTRAEVESAANAAGFKEAAAQIAGDNTVLLRLPTEAGKQEMNANEADALVEKLKTTFPGVTKGGFERIGASISKELTRNALSSITLSSAFIVLYLAFRFAIGGFKNGLKFGVSAIIAMLHDIAVLIGVFCFLGWLLNWKIDSLFLTAALTVVGFSVHDTIIIFDRIRENLQHRGEKANLGNLIDDSINETFARSLFTSGTVVLTLLALLIFGGSVIRPLNAALLVGILSGTYSSIFNAAPMVFDWQRKFGKHGQGLAEVKDGKDGKDSDGPAPSASQAPSAASAEDKPERSGTWAQGPRPKRK
ncbi:protein translocase subunit SecD [Armatimonas rosea]|uniref:Multifunctional fusion protein n=1 Tax=Armatimonas rosea TaxID=685828 RepID=A0A7W9W8K5_ARMRO|nr:protein translocase subunit SecD [Armatimonas rosea]MBB6052878.1 SecD/SecF fusion protein [Armatimonas rosea]